MLKCDVAIKHIQTFNLCSACPKLFYFYPNWTIFPSILTKCFPDLVFVPLNYNRSEHANAGCHYKAENGIGTRLLTEAPKFVLA